MTKSKEELKIESKIKSLEHMIKVRDKRIEDDT